MKKHAGPSGAPRDNLSLPREDEMAPTDAEVRELEVTEVRTPGLLFVERLVTKQRQVDAQADEARRALVGEVIEKARPHYERCLPAVATLRAFKSQHGAFVAKLEEVPWPRLQRGQGFTVEMTAISAKSQLTICTNCLRTFERMMSEIASLWERIERGILGYRVIGPGGSGWSNTEELIITTRAFVNLPDSFKAAVASLERLVVDLDNLVNDAPRPEGETVIVVRRQPTPPPIAGEASTQQTIAEM